VSVPASTASAELQRLVLGWYEAEGRTLPWRRSRDPYRILVSEFMLQQTQAARVKSAYEAFLARFPSVGALASAARGEVLCAWRGLGYNRRAVNLHRAAGVVMVRHGGLIPDDLEALRALPGVGEYTARAVLAFAFGFDTAPVDTNIARVLCRAVAGRPLSGRALRELAEQSVPSGRGPLWSDALMDLGARHCRARAPRCEGCPLTEACVWRTRGGDDPVSGTGASGRPPARFAGSDRYHRGRLVDGLRAGPLPLERLAEAGNLDDAARLARLIDGLIADGLAEWSGPLLRLPVSPEAAHQ
jgi:A/G-specific adenine glycosylase